MGRKQTDDAYVLSIPNDSYRSIWTRFWLRTGSFLNPLVGRVRGAGRLQAWLSFAIGQPRRRWRTLQGQEDLEFPAAWHLLDLTPEGVDIVHCHNLHGRYFDLRVIASLSQQVPVVLTLHDAWLLSGHCAHSFDCERWKTGCGNCPDLTIYPAIRRDATAYNWRRKRDIYACSCLYVTTPSQWLMTRVEESMLAPAVQEAMVIPNGVDLSIFHPVEDRKAVRAALGIPQGSKVLLFAATGIRRSKWRDFQMMCSAVAQVAEQLEGRQVLFLALGEDAAPEYIGRALVRFVPYQADPTVVARYYQAADVYVHAARADTFPNVVLEALACGTPVVATAVGGIPEQIRDDVTGYLVPPGDAGAMAGAMKKLLTDDALGMRLGRNAAEDAQRRFDLNRQVDVYIRWYRKILENWKRGQKPKLEKSLCAAQP